MFFFFQKMVTLVEELPFVAVVNGDKLNITCSNCFATKVGNIYGMV